MKPNLIYIFADQLAYNRLGYNKDKYALTPFLDNYQKNCVVMDNCVSNHPVCAPYRASLLTGKYTTSTGMVINEIRLNPNHVSFADVLNENGYDTSYMGKWHLYAAQLGHHFDPKNSYIPVGRDRLGFKKFEGYNFHHEYYAPKAYYHKDSPEKIYVDKYEPDAQVDMAITELERLSSKDEPFAFFMSIGTPHDPWVKENVPEEFYNKFKDVDIPYPVNYSDKNDRHADLWAKFKKKEREALKSWYQVYYAMVNNLDQNIERLMKKIEDMGLFKNSIVVFTSDHGECFGAHGRHAKNIFYEEAIRVPFLLRYDGVLKPHVSDSIFSSVDIMPTLLSLMDLKCPDKVEGTDKTSYIKKEKIEDEYDGSLLMCTGPTAIWGPFREWRAYRTKRYTYAIYRSDKMELLFDNIKDPYQMNNLIKDPNYKYVLSNMKDRMKKEMERIGDDFESNLYYMFKWTKNRIIKENLVRRKH